MIACAPRSDRHRIRALLALYRRVDREIARFQKRSQLHCLAGCGRCCDDPSIETTPLEMMPLAIELTRRGEAEATLASIDERHAEGRCVFYRPDAHMPWRGRCAVYEWRPLICRLFGFNAARNAEGTRRINTCATIKEMHPHYQSVEHDVRAGASIPDLPAFATQAAMLDPHYGTARLPINAATRVALQRVGLLTKLATPER